MDLNRIFTISGKLLFYFSFLLVIAAVCLTLYTWNKVGFVAQIPQLWSLRLLILSTVSFFISSILLRNKKILVGVFFYVLFFYSIFLYFRYREYPQIELTDNSITETLNVNGYKFDMVFVEGGSFLMGATKEQLGYAKKNEFPAHKKDVESFYIGKYEVTQGLWKAVMGECWIGLNAFPYAQSDKHPMCMLRYDDCVSFCEKISQLTGKRFRLPTESEWEYAARGGKKSKHFIFSGSNDPDSVAIYWFNNRRNHIVGTRYPNELGIYDMSGNVWEWCSDYYKLYGTEEISDSTIHVVRGGSWYQDKDDCRVSSRFSLKYNYRDRINGFRLLMEPY